MPVVQAVKRAHDEIGGEDLAVMRVAGKLNIHRRLHIGQNLRRAVIQHQHRQIAAHIL